MLVVAGSILILHDQTVLKRFSESWLSYRLGPGALVGGRRACPENLMGSLQPRPRSPAHAQVVPVQRLRGRGTDAEVCATEHSVERAEAECRHRRGAVVSKPSLDHSRPRSRADLLLLAQCSVSTDVGLGSTCVRKEQQNSLLPRIPLAAWWTTCRGTGVESELERRGL